MIRNRYHDTIISNMKKKLTHIMFPYFYTCSWKRKVVLLLTILTTVHMFYGDYILKNIHSDSNRSKISNSPVHKHIINESNAKHTYEQSRNEKSSVDADHAYTRVQKIFLISSSPRTGSSYTAGILTAMPNSSYYFEPFWINRASSDHLKVGKNTCNFIVEINTFQMLIHISII